MFSYSFLRKLTKTSKSLVRYKSSNPNHWSNLRKKTQATDKALEHFDDFYAEIFGKKWEGIRQALKSQQKYIAVVNNYSDSSEIQANLTNSGAHNIRKLFNLEKQAIMDQTLSNRRAKSLENTLKSAEEQEESPVQVLTASPNKNHLLSLEKNLEQAKYDENRLVDSRNALSSEILHEFIPASKIKGKDDFVLESSHFSFGGTNDFKVKIEREFDIHFPEHLNAFCYEKYNTSGFSPPKQGQTGVLNYYLLDGGSLLPVLALDLKPNNSVLDLCSAPGGKSLLILQTLYPAVLQANDLSFSRLKRVEKVFQQYLFDFEDKWLKTGKIRITNQDARLVTEDDFDRVLVDVPCTTDRHSLHDNDNNIFSPKRVKERLLLPELQTELLVKALKLVRVGGIVVYSTCTLSPVQNDGVVNVALKKAWEDNGVEVVVKDLSPALLQTKEVYTLAPHKLLRFGHLVVPSRGHNYGPMYFCKIQRIK